MKKNIFLYTVLIFLILPFFVGCAAKKDPLQQFRKALARYPEYSVVLEDMKEEGNFFKNYFHRYKIITGRREKGKEEMVVESAETEWYPVSESFYRRYENYLGMTVLSKDAEGKIIDVAQPPGYQYVGDSRYGRWRTDERGNSFWEFYGKYMFMRTLFGMGTRTIFQRDYDTYRQYRRANRPYFGPKREYGTYGENTKKTYRSFFERRRERELARKRSFNERLGKRIGRSRTGTFRSRGGGFGK